MLHRLSQVAGFINRITHYALTSLKARLRHSELITAQATLYKTEQRLLVGLIHFKDKIVSQDALRITEEASGSPCTHDRS
jgi:hypothetical protein